MMGYSTLTRAQKLEPYQQTQFSVIPRHLFLWGILFLCRGYSQHIVSPPPLTGHTKDYLYVNISGMEVLIKLVYLTPYLITISSIELMRQSCHLPQTQIHFTLWLKLSWLGSARILQKVLDIWKLVTWYIHSHSHADSKDSIDSFTICSYWPFLLAGPLHGIQCPDRAEVSFCFSLVVFYDISTLVDYLMTNSVMSIYIYIYIYIHDLLVNSLSSSWRAASTDIPDPLSPRLPIIHRLRQVFRVTSRIIT